MKDLAQIALVARHVAAAAGAHVLAAYRGTQQLEFKGAKAEDPVTIVDRETETFLRSELRNRFPDHGFVGEEHADDLSDRPSLVWALDPLDGTMNFAARVPLWGISLGLLQDGVPVVGCIWVPVGPTLGPGVYHAHRGGGAWFDDAAISVSHCNDERGRIMGMPGDYRRALRLRRPPRGTPRHQAVLPDGRSFGSCTAEMVLAATGTLRLTLFLQPRIWDVAAGAVIVNEAGGTVRTWQKGGWTHLERFEPERERAKRGDSPKRGSAAAEPALRHWSRPVVAGAPDAVERVLGRLDWRPRLPLQLRRLLEVVSSR